MTKHTKKKSFLKTESSAFKQYDPFVAGIDIGSTSIFVCAGISDKRQEVREFSTFTPDLRAMAAWFKQIGTTSIAMESTSVYWIPVYDILEEEGFKVLLVNAHHLKNVPGRKTDVQDCQWIQRLHSHGLLQGSFRPEGDFLTLRSYVRHRSRLFESAGVQIQLMHKALVMMNLQLNQVLSDITGITGMDIIRAIVAGERNPKKLALYRNKQCKRSSEEIEKALDGNYRPEHIFALQQTLGGYDFFHTQINACEEEIKKVLERLQSLDAKKKVDDMLITISPEKRKNKNVKKTPSNRSPYGFDALEMASSITKVDLSTIPGFEGSTAIKILSEIGTDMSRWPSVKHFTSWLGLCPKNKISGGRILSSKTMPSANKAAQAFRLAANSMYGSKTALGAYFRRMRARLGAPMAITATAHKLARIFYAMIKEGKKFFDIGQDYYEKQYKARKVANLKRQASELGFSLTPA